MADETKRIIDQDNDQTLSAGDYVMVDSQEEGTRKFDLGTELQGIKEDLSQLEGGGVPSNVRQSIYNLLNAAAYASTGHTSDIATVQSWASSVTAISLNQSTASITGTGTVQLVATTTPTGGTVTWSSSNTAVATVSSSGLVTGVSNGTATITATSGNVSATCSVTVSGIATLSSISAVYTQSGTVYDTDSLDDLKTDLVVTAYFSDSTTQTVTNYTLSGTLTEGTSTITVSYGGKTTTFNVIVTHQGSGQSDENEWTDGVDYTYTTVTDKYINQNDGTEISYAYWNATPYLYCEGAAKLTFTATEESPVMANAHMVYNAFYDSNKNYISGFSVTGLSAGVGATCDVSVPATASYFRASGKYQVYNDSNAYATITPKAS